MKLKSCGIVPILKQDNKIEFLLIHHQSGHWAFPKGNQERNETEIETAERELKEETGIKDFEILDNDICFTERYCFEKDNKSYNKEVRYFLALVKNPRVQLLKSELQNYKWLEFKKAIKLITYQESRGVLRQINKYLKNNR